MTYEEFRCFMRDVSALAASPGSLVRYCRACEPAGWPWYRVCEAHEKLLLW